MPNQDEWWQPWLTILHVHDSCVYLPETAPPGAAILALMLPDNVSRLWANSPAKLHQLPELPWAAAVMTLSQGEALRS